MRTSILVLSIIIFTACSQKGDQKSSDSNPNIFTTQIGEYKVHLLSEGQQLGKTSILIGATPEILEECVPKGTFPNATNAFLIQTPVKNILIDTGLGKEISYNLESLGLTENDITDILVTHMHRDHIGGLMKGENPRFPQANVRVSIPEHDYWFETQEDFEVTSIVRSYPNYSNFGPEVFSPNNKSGYTLVEGARITAIPAYGHTPGHVAYLIESKNEKLLIWGDVTHAMAVQMSYPEVAVTYDSNPAEAVISRIELLEYASQNEIPVAGMHIAYPAIGKIQKEDKGYKFLPF